MRPEPAPMHLDDRRALGVLEHVGDGRLLHVEDLAADRQQSLELGVARQLRGAEGAVALDDEQLAALDVVVRQSTSLAGSAEDSSAFLRRCTSRWVCAATRARAALAIFSATALTTACRPAAALAPGASSVATTERHDAVGAPGCRGPPWSGPRTAARPGAP